MRRTVTTGIDGSVESLAAAQWAAREARVRGLPLALLHAGYTPAARTGLPEIDVPAERRDHALTSAVREVRGAFPDLEVMPLTVAGPPADALLAAAGESEMLVLGSQGFSGFAGFMLGSVALDVTTRSSVPVVLVRSGRPTGNAAQWPVLLGLDLEAADDELIGFAFEAAAARGTPLDVLCAWKVPAPSSYGWADAPLLEPDSFGAAEQSELAAALYPWREKYHEVSVSTYLVQGRAAHRLVRAAEQAGLVVIGRRATAGPRLGPVAHAAIHHAPCPVAVVPHGHPVGAFREPM